VTPTATTGDLRQHVNGRDVKKSSGAKKHSDTGRFERVQLKKNVILIEKKYDTIIIIYFTDK